MNNMEETRVVYKTNIHYGFAPVTSEVIVPLPPSASKAGSVNEDDGFFTGFLFWALFF